MYEIVRYEGGVYRNNILKEWIEDIGGFIIQEHVMQLDVYMTVALPRSELENFKREAKKYKGKVVETPLAGIEIRDSSCCTKFIKASSTSHSL